MLRDELLPTSHHPVAAIEIRTLPFSEQAAVFASASLVVGVEERPRECGLHEGGECGGVDHTLTHT